MTVVVDYASLKQSLIDITHRSELSTYLDGFIQGAQENIENDILADNFGNGIRFQEAPFSGTITSGTVAVPADWMAPKLLTLLNVLGGTVSDLSFMTTVQLYSRYPSRQAAAAPQYIAREGANFIFGPYPDTGYNLGGIYYAKAPLLSVSQTTNWMVLQAPLLIQAACLVEAYKYLSNSEAIGGWQGIYQSKLNSLILRDKAERYAPGTLAITAV